MNVTFYFVRHGQTYFNQIYIMQGWCDSPLTEQGIAEARQTAEALKEVPFTRAYSSSSERARDTRDIILQYHPGIPVKDRKDLREFDYGRLDGLKIADILDEVRRRGVTDDFSDVGGDTRETCSQRIRQAFAGILQECQDGDQVLVVSHGAFGRHLLQLLEPALPRIYSEEDRAQGNWLGNGGIMVFAYDEGNWRLLQKPCSPAEFRSR